MAKRSCSPKKEDNDDEKGDNDYCCSCLIHTRKDKKEQDHGGSTKKQVQAKTKSKTTKMCDDNEKVLLTWSQRLWACKNGTNARIHTKHKLSIDNAKCAKPKHQIFYTNLT